MKHKKLRNIEQPDDKLGKVGYKYIQGFMKRWKHIISSKKGQRFELDRSQWTKYSNFKQMYDCIEDAMLQSGLAEKLPQPIWMDMDGHEVASKEESYGQKCTIKITHPELCIVGDEVGGNTSQKGDGHVGGKRFVGPKNCVSQLKSSKKDKKFTVVGFTALTGEPVMCVIIIEGKTRQIEVELGIDYSAPWTGSAEDDDFIEQNTGHGKRFPGGPTCQFRGKEVPCFVRFNESFVEYINQVETKWCVSIGVPYGTSFWQVGDSKEQNGCFKIGTYRAKDTILHEREQNMIQDMGIQPSDIVPIVNMAWQQSFMRVKQNKKAIAERGWFPYNRNLLNNEEIRATMTMSEADEEKNCTQTMLTTSPTRQPTGATIITPTSSPELQQQEDISRSNMNNTGTLNFGSGMAFHVLKRIVKEVDLATVREKIENEKKDGVRKKQLLQDVKRVTAGKLVQCGTFVIGQSVADAIKKQQFIKQKEEEEKKKRQQKRLEQKQMKHEMELEKKRKREKEHAERMRKRREEDEIRTNKQKARDMERQNKAFAIIEHKKKHTWKVSDYRTVLMAMKKKSDGPLPSTLNELSALYDEMSEREVPSEDMFQEDTEPLSG